VVAIRATFADRVELKFGFRVPGVLRKVEAGGSPSVLAALTAKTNQIEALKLLANVPKRVLLITDGEDAHATGSEGSTRSAVLRKMMIIVNSFLVCLLQSGFKCND
jgi:hypothetical protein